MNQLIRMTMNHSLVSPGKLNNISFDYHQVMSDVLTELLSTTYMQKLPSAVSIHLHDHFRNGFIKNLKSTVDKQGKKCFNIQLTENDMTHLLLFDDQGLLKKSQSTRKIKRKFNKTSIALDGMY